MSQQGKGMLGLLGALGFPTTNENGHDLGCMCHECKVAREVRTAKIERTYRERGKPTTILGILADEGRKRRERS